MTATNPIPKWNNELHGDVGSAHLLTDNRCGMSLPFGMTAPYIDGFMEKQLRLINSSSD